MKKKRNMNRNKNKKVRVPTYKYIAAILISVITVLIPWISYFKIINVPVEMLDFIPNNKGVLIDFFLYYKQIAIGILAVTIIIFITGEIIFTDKVITDIPLNNKENRIFIYCSGIYILMVILSCIFSEYRSISISGYPTDGEGVFILISYMIIFLAGMNYFCYEKSINILKKVLIIFMITFVSFSFIEFLYKSIFEIEFFKNMIIPEAYSSLRESMKNDAFRGMSSLSFYNPNYYGVMCIILFPIAVSLFVGEKNKHIKIGYFLLSTGLFICTLTSKTTTVVYIMIVEVCILTAINIKSISENYKETIKYVIAFLIIAIGINFISGNKLTSLIIDSLSNKSVIKENDKKFILKDINMESEILEIVGENNSLVIKLEKDKEDKSKLRFFNRNEEQLESFKKENYIYFKDKDFESIAIENLEYGIVIDIGYMDNMKFYITEDGFKGVGQNGVEIDKITRDKIFGEKFYSLATGRGYAWVNTLPILKETIFLGKGPGNFAMNFQQNDYVGLMNTHENTSLIIDKPHNMYLQIAVNTGIISLIGILIIFGVMIRKSSEIYLKRSKYKNKQDEFNLGIGIFIGILGYLIAGLTNDSIVTVTPILWMLSGANISITYYLKRSI